MAEHEGSKTAAEDLLSPAVVEKAVEDALEAIARAESLEDLKQVRLEHDGDRSALARANQSIGKIDPSERAAAGKLLGGARGQDRRALGPRKKELNAARAEQSRRQETGEVTVGTGETDG